jgi:hypothetical protein
MSLFDPVAPPNVTSTETTAAAAPQYLTDYLTKLAESGVGALGTTSAEGTLTPYTGEELIASLPQNLKDLYETAPTTLTRYQTPMDEALKSLQSGATGVSASDISAFYDPYQQDVIDEMSRQSAQNVQQSMLPALKAAFAGQGAFGSRRYAGALGQAMGDVQQDLLGQQAKLRSEGYKTALEAALKERGYDIQAGQGLSTLGSNEATAASSASKSLGDIGTQELAYEQAKMDAPLTRAMNVAQILRGYTYPTTTEKKYEGPASAYGTSAMGQVAGLGSLIGSLFPTSVDPRTGQVIQSGIGWSGLSTLGDAFRSLFPSSSSSTSTDWSNVQPNTLD